MKTLKLFSLFTCMILLGMNTNLFSQDVIFLSNGDEIEAKVTKVGNAEIEYKKWSNQEGPTYTEMKSNILMIKYQNGEKDVFGIDSPVIPEANTVYIRPQSTEKEYKVFFGINGGLGFGHCDNFKYYYSIDSDVEDYDYDETSWLILNATIGTDLIFPIGNVFGMGPYLSLGYRNDPTVTIGGWAMFRFSNNTALMLGTGLNIVMGWNTGVSERIGFKFKNRIYLFGELTTQSDQEYEYNNYSWGETYTENYYDGISFILHLGFKLF